MAKAIPGKAYSISFNDTYLLCQTDLTFENTADITTDEACKPDPNEAWSGAQATTSTVNSTSWTASGTFRATDALTNNQNLMLKTYRAGTVGDLQIVTFDGPNTPLDFATVISGEAIVNSITLNASVDGNATYDISFTGNGDYDIETVPTSAS